MQLFAFLSMLLFSLQVLAAPSAHLHHHHHHHHHSHRRLVHKHSGHVHADVPAGLLPEVILPSLTDTDDGGSTSKNESAPAVPEDLIPPSPEAENPVSALRRRLVEPAADARDQDAETDKANTPRSMRAHLAKYKRRGRGHRHS
ncbi:hypothetical protein VDGD_03312 [Verticillium dahliae]|nr:hypothetical protein VDGD_03312 [Verticillium dahliae]